MIIIVDISKGNLRFAPVMYLDSASKHIDTVPQSIFVKITKKYKLHIIM